MAGPKGRPVPEQLVETGMLARVPGAGGALRFFGALARPRLKAASQARTLRSPVTPGLRARTG